MLDLQCVSVQCFVLALRRTITAYSYQHPVRDPTISRRLHRTPCRMLIHGVENTRGFDLVTHPEALQTNTLNIQVEERSATKANFIGLHKEG